MIKPRAYVLSLPQTAGWRNCDPASGKTLVLDLVYTTDLLILVVSLRWRLDLCLPTALARLLTDRHTFKVAISILYYT